MIAQRTQYRLRDLERHSFFSPVRFCGGPAAMR
jgi:hypothetical protein